MTQQELEVKRRLRELDYQKMLIEEMEERNQKAEKDWQEKKKSQKKPIELMGRE